MNHLLDLLAKIPFRPLGTVVHLGAGATDPAAHAALQTRRLVLVDGRPEAVDELRALAPPAPTRLEVVSAAVAPSGGPLNWHRHNLPWLDGPADASHLSTLIPRLQHNGTEIRQATAITLLLSGLMAADGDDGCAEANVLLIDLPGQETALLAALDAQSLAGFGWIGVRASGSTAALSVPLAERFFDPVPGAVAADDLWPAALYRRSARRAEQTLGERVAALATELEAQAGRLREAEAQASVSTLLAEERGARLEALLDQAAQSQALAARCDAAEQALAVCRAEGRALQSTLADLRADQARLSAAVDAAQGACETLRQRADKAEQEAAVHREERGRLERALAALQSERDAAQRAQQALAAQLAETQQAAVKDREALSDRDARQRLLDAEILRAEAQLELVKDVLLREKNF